MIISVTMYNESFKELNEKINYQIETGKNQYQVMMESFSKDKN